VAYVTTQALVGGMALWIYGRELAWQPLARAFREFEIDREMLAFALPQNLNMTLERFITNIDIIMLGLFGVSASTTGFYGAGAMIVRELQSIKQVFSNAFAPHIVRLHRQQQTHQLSESFSRTSRWIISLAIPALLAVAVLRSDLLRLVHPDFAGEPALFMLLLLPIPYLQCGFGLAGNIVVMTGHSRLNLLNSSTTGAANIALNVWLIPLLGPVGAAAASALSSLLKAVMEVVEARYVARARLLWSEIYKPHAAGLVAVLALGAALQYVPAVQASLGHRLLLLLTVMSLYAGTLIVLLGRLPRLPAVLRNPS
jgi:O-antigen/teichoic acid export membrane protein